MSARRPDRRARYPIGAMVTVDDLAGPASPTTLARLRSSEPVSWVPAIGGWLVTAREPVVEALRDWRTYTVDDPRFSTAAVVGTSMLSLDGPEHRRHRSPFVPPLRPPALAVTVDELITAEAANLVAGFAPRRAAELRTELAGPLAVTVIASVLGLDADGQTVLGWYRAIVDGVERVSAGAAVGDRAIAAVDELRAAVARSAAADRWPRTSGPDGEGRPLDDEEWFSNVAVVMFGGIETAEGMTANLLAHLLGDQEALDRVRADPSLVPRAIDESLRLEPAAAVVDRYATVDAELGVGGFVAAIAAGDLVRLSLSGANRDPAVFAAPDRFDLDRANSGQQLGFVTGPHACIGDHLARRETAAALAAVLELGPDLAIDRARSTLPTGLLFRKPEAITARW